MYGYRPKIWFLLNRHDRSDTLLQEIQSTPFDETPGNNIGLIFWDPKFLALTLRLDFLVYVCMSPSAGEAVAFTARYLLTPAAGRRPMVPGVVVIIEDKKSSDNLTLGTSNLRAAGAIVKTNLSNDKM